MATEECVDSILADELTNCFEENLLNDAIDSSFSFNDALIDTPVEELMVANNVNHGGCLFCGALLKTNGSSSEFVEVVCDSHYNKNYLTLHMEIAQ